MIRGVIFDLDGTLADSRLDFVAMRHEMELPPDVPILEALTRLDPLHADRCRAILHRHELAGAERAVLLPGVAELYMRCIRAAFTRRSPPATAGASPRRRSPSWGWASTWC